MATMFRIRGLAYGPVTKRARSFNYSRFNARPRSAHGASLPRCMKMMIQQLTATYSLPHKDITTGELYSFRNSLMLRLDLHKKDLNKSQTIKPIKSRWGCVDTFVAKAIERLAGSGCLQNRCQRRLDLFSLPSQRVGPIILGMVSHGALHVQRCLTTRTLDLTRGF